MGTSTKNAQQAFHTVASLARHLGVSEKTVRRWIDAGQLPAHRLGRQLRISDRDLQVFLLERRYGSAGYDH